MKKIFAFAIALVSMAVSMVSCNNDDAEFIEQPMPVAVEQQEAKMMDIDFVVAVTAVQQDYFDESYVIEFGGKQITIALSDMQPANASQIAAFASVSSMVDAAGFDGIKYYAFNLGKVDTYKAGKVVRHNIEVKADHPTVEGDFMMRASYFVVDGTITSNRVCADIESSIAGTDENLAEFAKVAMQYIN